MTKSADRLKPLLSELTTRARQRGWSDAGWARHAAVPKETRCRPRSRSDCDLGTLAALADALAVTFAVVEPQPAVTPMAGRQRKSIALMKHGCWT